MDSSKSKVDEMYSDMFKGNKVTIQAQVASTYKKNTHALVVNDIYLQKIDNYRFYVNTTFICKSACVKYNLMYVTVIILCTDLGAITVSKIN